MAKKYKFVRLPVGTYNIYKNIQNKMEKDVSLIYGKRKPLTMTKVFLAVASPKFNENFIQIDERNLKKLVRRNNNE
jgi:hypothetical protein